MAGYLCQQSVSTPGGLSHLSGSSSHLPDTSEANLKKVGRWKQGRDCCCLTGVGFGWVNYGIVWFG
jgi:hypothetical protein